jgi:hypothetical protein
MISQECQELYDYLCLLRGGSWLDYARFARVSVSSYYTPDYQRLYPWCRCDDESSNALRINKSIIVTTWQEQLEELQRVGLVSIEPAGIEVIITLLTVNDLLGRL